MGKWASPVSGLSAMTNEVEEEMGRDEEPPAAEENSDLEELTKRPETEDRVAVESAVRAGRSEDEVIVTLRYGLIQFIFKMLRSLIKLFSHIRSHQHLALTANSPFLSRDDLRRYV